MKRTRMSVGVAAALAVAGGGLVVTVTLSGGEEVAYEDALAAAVAGGDPELCDTINSDRDIFDDHGGVIVPAEHARRDCRVDYAVESGDPDLCDDLPIDSTAGGQRGECLGRLALRHDRPELCDRRNAIDRSTFADDRHASCRELTGGDPPG